MDAQTNINQHSRLRVLCFPFGSRCQYIVYHHTPALKAIIVSTLELLSFCLKKEAHTMLSDNVVIVRKSTN